MAARAQGHSEPVTRLYAYAAIGSSSDVRRLRYAPFAAANTGELAHEVQVLFAPPKTWLASAFRYVSRDAGSGHSLQKADLAPHQVAR